MKISINSIVREMTAEEIAEMDALSASMQTQEESFPTAEDRITALEEALEMILSGVTE